MSLRLFLALGIGWGLWWMILQIASGATNGTFLHPDQPPFYVLHFIVSALTTYLTDRHKVLTPLVAAGGLWAALVAAGLLGYGTAFGLSFWVYLIGVPLSLGIAWAVGFVMAKLKIF